MANTWNYADWAKVYYEETHDRIIAWYQGTKHVNELGKADDDYDQALLMPGN